MIVDGATGYGRAVMRGVMRYANLSRKWIIHKQFRGLSPDTILNTWPACDGAIFAGVTQEIFEVVSKAAKHVVRCSGSADPAISPAVCMNDYEVGRIAAKHLLDCQLENFGFVGLNDRGPLAKNRFEGFRNSLREAGFECSEAGVGWPDARAMNPEAPAALQLATWLRELPKPVGIMAADDVLADFVSTVCLNIDLAVPEHVAIIGVNNDDLHCDSACPPLSSVDCDYSRVGYVAASILDRMIAGEKLPDEERLIRLPPLGVVKRQSTDLFAVDAPEVAEALRYIREHACDPCSVTDILSVVPVGRRWLERQFFKTLGRAPNDEIQRVRIEAAKRYLIHSDLKLSEIASRCGFSAEQSLSRAFLHGTGVTPAKFRRDSSPKIRSRNESIQNMPSLAPY